MFNIKDKVTHSLYGDGEVVNIFNNGLEPIYGVKFIEMAHTIYVPEIELEKNGQQENTC